MSLGFTSQPHRRSSPIKPPGQSSAKSGLIFLVNLDAEGITVGNNAIRVLMSETVHGLRWRNPDSDNKLAKIE